MKHFLATAPVVSFSPALATAQAPRRSRPIAWRPKRCGAG